MDSTSCEVSSIFVYHMPGTSLTGLWLIHPDLVQVSFLIELGLLLMVMFAGVLLATLSSQSLHATCLLLASWVCLIGVL